MIKQMDYVHDVCMIGQGAKCCKYLMAGTEGLECAKISNDWRDIVNKDWEKNSHIAQGDNCNGVDLLKLEK